MTLDLTQLPSLLSLPCVIDSDRDLFQTAILATAESFDRTVYILTVKEGESLFEYLHRVYDGEGPYHMDCTIYAQLAAFVLSGKWPIKGGKILIFIAIELGDFMLWTEKIPEMGYISVCDEAVGSHLNKIPTSCKGQWCIRLSTDEYLGLASDGPHVFSMSTWVQRLRDGLISYSQTAAEPSLNINQILINLLYCYIKVGKVDTWGFYPQKGHCAVSAQWTEDAVIVTDNETIQTFPLMPPRTPVLAMDITSATVHGDRARNILFGKQSKIYCDSDSFFGVLPLRGKFPWTISTKSSQALAKCVIAAGRVALGRFDRNLRNQRNTVDFTSFYPSTMQNPPDRQVHHTHHRKQQQRSNPPKHVNMNRSYFNKNSGR